MAIITYRGKRTSIRTINARARTYTCADTSLVYEITANKMRTKPVSHKMRTREAAAAAAAARWARPLRRWKSNGETEHFISTLFYFNFLPAPPPPVSLKPFRAMEQFIPRGSVRRNERTTRPFVQVSQETEPRKTSPSVADSYLDFRYQWLETGTFWHHFLRSLQERGDK